MEEVER